MFDFDGVFTDNRVWVNESRRGGGRVLARRRHRPPPADEIGVPYVDRLDRAEPGVAVRAEKLRARLVHGVDDKRQVLRAEASAAGLRLDHVAYLGNDVNDSPGLEAAGFPSCLGRPAGCAPSRPLGARTARWARLVRDSAMRSGARAESTRHARRVHRRIFPTSDVQTGAGSGTQAARTGWLGGVSVPGPPGSITTRNRSPAAQPLAGSSARGMRTGSAMTASLFSPITSTSHPPPARAAASRTSVSRERSTSAHRSTVGRASRTCQRTAQDQDHAGDHDGRATERDRAAGEHESSEHDRREVVAADDDTGLRRGDEERQGDHEEPDGQPVDSPPGGARHEEHDRTHDDERRQVGDQRTPCARELIQKRAVKPLAAEASSYTRSPDSHRSSVRIPNGTYGSRIPPASSEIAPRRPRSSARHRVRSAARVGQRKGARRRTHTEVSFCSTPNHQRTSPAAAADTSAALHGAPSSAL